LHGERGDQDPAFAGREVAVESAEAETADAEAEDGDEGAEPAVAVFGGDDA